MTRARGDSVDTPKLRPVVGLPSEACEASEGPVLVSPGQMPGSRYQCQFCVIDGRPIIRSGITY